MHVGACGAGDSADGCRQLIGNVWEWTASDFVGYPNFERDAYHENSEQFFGHRKVLRGGAWAGLSASGRQNALAAALKEYGALRRTIYAACYLADPAYRRKISRQLNKGESLHALKRDLLYHHGWHEPR